MTRKYRQSGYQDDDRNDRDTPTLRPTEEKRERGPRRGYGPREPQKVNMPRFRDVLKCARCGTGIAVPVLFDAQCPKCSSALHSCAQCTWFDTGSRFECGQPVPQRILPKDGRNTCTYFEATVTVERKTQERQESSPTTTPRNARQAFDDLFK